MDQNPDFKIDEAIIRFAYRKYVPIITKLLFKFECSKLQFCDDHLRLIFNYLVWFEDRSGNRIPVDFNSGGNSTRQFEASREFQFFDERRGGGAGQNSQANRYYFLPGITEKSFYDQLKITCYPNAPPESLICYELFSLHSGQLTAQIVDYQFRYLVEKLGKIQKSSN